MTRRTSLLAGVIAVCVFAAYSSWSLFGNQDAGALDAAFGSLKAGNYRNAVAQALELARQADMQTRKEAGRILRIAYSSDALFDARRVRIWAMYEKCPYCIPGEIEYYASRENMDSVENSKGVPAQERRQELLRASAEQGYEPAIEFLLVDARQPLVDVKYSADYWRSLRSELSNRRFDGRSPIGRFFCGRTTF